MIKKVLATAGVAAAVVGVCAPSAAAVGDHRVSTQLGNHSTQSYGNTGTEGAETDTPLPALKREEARLRALR
ncbi:hypothetical protein [Streptomyces sp. TRM64462]|uniref:hypothetical protein n=1 Tax=Streptomyces sp. TRM64462 TaxID=2741726 RepID=UPI001586303E|nr:hypothetical protein [Streptomyces sp. TRM64462]